MALDGIFLHFLCEELKTFSDSRIEKIYQPSRDELVLFLRSREVNAKLLISAKSGFSRIGLIEETPDNPQEPPNFCKLLRKHIGGARIVSFEQKGLDRAVVIRLSAYNEMGDMVFPYLIVELFSNRSNIILCDQNGRILDALHRSDIETSERLIQPGAYYRPLPPQNKLNPFIEDIDLVADTIININKPLGSAFMTVIDGVSPLISRELAYLSGLDPDVLPSENNKSAIKKVLTDFCRIINENHSPCLLNFESGSDFTYMPISQYGGSAELSFYNTYNTLLNEYYYKRERASRLRTVSGDLVRLLSNIEAKTKRKLEYRTRDLEKSRDREHLRIYGELIKANLYMIDKGSSSVTVQNYYDENLAPITIPLNPALSPAANAAKYFKDYKKSSTAEHTLEKLIEEDKAELIYIDSVLDELARADSFEAIFQIREELTDAGYIKNRDKRKQLSKSPQPREYTDKNGFKILVGRNNKENDILTLKTASKEDIWLHTKDIAGSHTVIIADGKAVPLDTIEYAAKLAALHSKAANSSNVPVDYTLIKYVKKPRGAKPGMVIYTHNHTLYVSPEKE